MNRCTAVPTAESMPSSWVPPSRVGIVLTNERTSSSVASVQDERQVAAEPVVLVLALQDERQGGDPLVVALGVDGVEEVGHPAVVAELDARLVLLVDELDDQPLVEVGLDLEPLGDERRGRS